MNHRTSSCEKLCVVNLQEKKTDLRKLHKWENSTKRICRSNKGANRDFKKRTKLINLYLTTGIIGSTSINKKDCNDRVNRLILLCLIGAALC